MQDGYPMQDKYPNLALVEQSVSRLRYDLSIADRISNMDTLSKWELKMRHELQALMVLVPRVARDVHRVSIGQRENAERVSAQDANARVAEILAEPTPTQQATKTAKVAKTTPKTTKTTKKTAKTAKKGKK